MRARALIYLAAILLSLRASATCDPDSNPVDCIEVLDPSLGKEVAWGPGSRGPDDSLFWAGGGGGVAGGFGFDAAGNFYSLSNRYGNRDIYRYTRSGGKELIARGVGANDAVGVPLGLSVDATNGRIYLSIVGNISGTVAIIAITGLPTLFDIIETYTPTATTLKFRVPAHPEGLPSADHFDTYWGHVSDLPDFTQAQPMACHYPASPPLVGDYLTVADTSPPPGPGNANYIVTAVTNGAQRRYGRKLINGVMSGRDPALLPGCPPVAMLSGASAVQPNALP